jgi:hypothetical protein
MAEYIKVHRKRAFRDSMRAYRIYIDGQKVGRVRNDATSEFEVAPGEHQVQLRIDLCRSTTVTVQVPQDGSSVVSAGPGSPVAMILGMAGGLITAAATSSLLRYPALEHRFTGPNR